MSRGAAGQPRGATIKNRRPLLMLIMTLVLLTWPTRGSEAVAVVAQRPDDEYVLEHEVDYEGALDEARNLRLDPGAYPGCKPCTSAEMRYCTDGSVLEDHCCCDNSYNEVLGFVEHTCRLGPEACQVRADDCAEYTRLRECCCHSYLASKWKYLAGGASAPTPALYTLTLGLSLVVVALYGRGAVR